MKISRGAIALVALAVAIAGCASQKEPAEQALAGIENTMQASGAQVERYLPDRHAAISARVQSLRDAVAAERYGDVVSEAPAVAEDLRRAVADAMIARATLRNQLEGEWNAMLDTVPKMIAAVDRKIAVQGSRPPQGMDRDGWKSLVDSYDAARNAWGEASAAMTNANFEDTVVAAREAKDRIAGVMETLGLPSA